MKRALLWYSIAFYGTFCLPLALIEAIILAPLWIWLLQGPEEGEHFVEQD